MSTTIDSGPTAPVPKDPQPSVDRIDELARRVFNGDILLPKFQREFVWSREQVLNLLDSVARNYPIGSILLWQSRQELRSENRIADLEIKVPKPDISCQLSSRRSAAPLRHLWSSLLARRQSK